MFDTSFQLRESIYTRLPPSRIVSGESELTILAGSNLKGRVHVDSDKKTHENNFELSNLTVNKVVNASTGRDERGSYQPL